MRVVDRPKKRARSEAEPSPELVSSAAALMAKARAAKLSRNRREEIAREGGDARAASLSPARRREIARQAGKGRLSTMSAKERSERAKKAAEARWGTKKKGKG